MHLAWVCVLAVSFALVSTPRTQAHPLLRHLQVENMIIQAVSRGQVRPPVDEEQLISLLEQISGGSATSSGPSITIKRKVADDDDW